MLGMILGSYNDYLYIEFGFNHLIIIVDIQRKINKNQSLNCVSHWKYVCKMHYYVLIVDSSFNWTKCLHL